MSNFVPNAEITLEEGTSLYKARSQQALSTLAGKGFAMPNPPQYQTAAGMQPYRGELPSRITDLSDHELGHYMGLLSEWNGYVQTQLAEADMMLLEAKATLELVEAKLRIAYQKDPDGSKKRSNPERDDYVRQDRRYVEAQSNTIYWETIFRYVKAIAFAAENAFATVSRRITQRGQEIDRMNRTGNATGHNNISGPVFGRRG